MIPTLPESKTPTVSLAIEATKDAGLIKADESDSLSTRYARSLSGSKECFNANLK
jgi:ATP-dependent DNA helicase RecG